MKDQFNESLKRAAESNLQSYALIGGARGSDDLQKEYAEVPANGRPPTT